MEVGTEEAPKDFYGSIVALNGPLYEAAMTLREQIKKIAAERVNPVYAEKVDFVTQVDHLAAKAFVEQWTEGSDTRAIRLAYTRLHNGGYVPEGFPAIL